MAADQQALPDTCPVEMAKKRPCGRPIYAAPPDTDAKPVCLMHSHDPDKDADAFQEEIKAILGGSSAHNPDDKFDFTRFVFLTAAFSEREFHLPALFYGATFTQDADFHQATFTQDANFSSAEFTQRALFSHATFTRYADFIDATFAQAADFYKATFTRYAKFSSATFTGAADFSWATFTHTARFYWATFARRADFSHATFTERADFGMASFTQAANFVEATFAETATFWSVRFQQPTQVVFQQVNKDKPNGLRARFVNCPIEEVKFIDVHWHRPKGRIVLQDELDSASGRSKVYGLVTVAYRQLVNNFEKTRNYSLAEDCFIGAMAMTRLDPANFLFARWRLARKLYKYWWARKLGEWFSVLNLYRLFSKSPLEKL